MKNNPITHHPNGHVSWHHKDGDKYVVTGTFPDGKRFAPVYCGTWHMAKCINIWCGTKWLLRDGKRYKILTVVN